jgi:hypothetical protein
MHTMRVCSPVFAPIGITFGIIWHPIPRSGVSAYKWFQPRGPTASSRLDGEMKWTWLGT